MHRATRHAEDDSTLWESFERLAPVQYVRMAFTEPCRRMRRDSESTIGRIWQVVCLVGLVVAALSLNAHFNSNIHFTPIEYLKDLYNNNEIFRDFCFITMGGAAVYILPQIISDIRWYATMSKFQRDMLEGRGTEWFYERSQLPSNGLPPSDSDDTYSGHGYDHSPGLASAGQPPVAVGSVDPDDITDS